MGVAAVEGLQGENRARDLKPGKVFATLKHLTGHGQPESGTNVGPAPYSERTLREFFFPPFEQAIALHTAKFVIGAIPRPPNWTGYRLLPLIMEFWQDRPFRLHDRVEFRRAALGEAWRKTRLYP